VGRVIDGKAVAAAVRAEVKAKVEFLRTTAGCVPGLATVLVGDDPASRVYVRTKQKACCEVGIASFSHQLEASTSEGELLGLIDTLNGRSDVHGILLQLPLPPGLSPQRVIERILPHKDADGLHPYNQGRLLAGDTGLRPCTPLGVLRLIDSTGVELKGKCATVVGRSSLVGKPVALMLLERHATVTLCHSRTQDLADEVGRADVVVAALGRARAIKRLHNASARWGRSNDRRHAAGKHGAGRRGGNSGSLGGGDGPTETYAPLRPAARCRSSHGELRWLEDARQLFRDPRGAPSRPDQRRPLRHQSHGCRRAARAECWSRMPGIDDQ
jgi:methylenetetrahydrofolate dehydrogenase (NADP+)/methenyltetrahydrofolate cyclohydrolase